jgi:hypothetical protein
MSRVIFLYLYSKSWRKFILFNCNNFDKLKFLGIFFSLIASSKKPIEILDKIWLIHDAETLENTRELQSNYLKKITEFFTFGYAAANGYLH